MLLADYKLNAQVRRLLVRRWIDLNQVDYGVTNGVVYLRGCLRPARFAEDKDPHDLRLEEITLATRLERSLRQIPGVRDVVFQLDHVVRTGYRWRRR